MKIAFLGNFSVSHSTETDYKNTLEDLGHTVVPLQESQATSVECLAAALSSNLFCWVNTHGWPTPGSMPMDEVLNILRARGIKTFGMHLDRYCGLNIGDGREDRVGTTPWWSLQYVFTADGGNDAFFKSRNVNHFWLPPAILKSSCFIGNECEELKCDVVWIGAKGYHREYPFREQLVTWLEQQKQWKVMIWGCGPRGGVRGPKLNDIYRNAKIVVGDSCFAGVPAYWSDRCPETLGRGGFLLHPFSVGMKFPMKTYLPQNLDDLGKAIEFWLSNHKEREEIRRGAFEWTKSCDTYHNRVRTMLNIMEIE